MNEWISELRSLQLLPSITLDAPLGFALLLIGGALAGEAVARWTRLPRVLGYTLAGAFAALLGLGIPSPVTGWLRLVIEWALGLLLFEIGARLRLRWLVNNQGLMLASLLEAGVSGLTVAAMLILFGLSWEQAIVVAVITLPASAAVAGRVALELGAEGQVTQRLSCLTALSTLYAVSLMVLVHSALIAGHAPDALQAVRLLVINILASLGLALLLAFGVGVVARRLDPRNESAVLLVLGLVLAAIAAARLLGASSILVPLLAGIVLRHSSERAWSWPRHFGTAGSAVVLVMFVLTGSAWSLDMFMVAGPLALALILTRGISKTLVVTALSPWSGISLRQGIALGITLTPLSATSLLMLSDFMLVMPEIGRTVAPLVLCTVAMLELCGPAAVQWGLIRAGDAVRAKQPRSAP